MKRRLKLKLDVERLAVGWPSGTRRRVEQAVKETWREEGERFLRRHPAPKGCKRAEASLALSDDVAVQSLNRRYRGKNQPTNVLTFALWEGPDSPITRGQPWDLGQIVLARETVEREAEAAERGTLDHLVHLVVHAMLHLLGHDHERSAREARRQEKLERRILARMGIANPY